MLSISRLGMWKSPVESPSNFSRSDLQRGREKFQPPNSTSPFISLTKANTHGFNGNSSPLAISSNSMYWSNQAGTDSFTPITNKESGEKRPETGNGYRLFGIQLVDNSTEENSPVVAASDVVGEDQPVISLDAESDRQSQPSNVNRSDVPTVSSDPEKSCLRSPQEMQSRQTRSCTKVKQSLKLLSKLINIHFLELVLLQA